MCWHDRGRRPPLDPTTSPAPTTVQRKGDPRALPRGHAEEDLEAWLADQRWRAALESYPLLAEPDRARLDLPDGADAE